MASKFETFAALHVPGDPVVLYNIWDVGSALAVIAAGAKALATGSHPVADANGWPDGQKVPIDFAFANAKRIVDAAEVPLTVDFEGAYSTDPEEGGANVARLKQTGAVGCNFEDQVIERRRASSAQPSGQAHRRHSPRSRRRFLHQRADRPFPQDADVRRRADRSGGRTRQGASPMPAPAASSSRGLPTRRRSNGWCARCRCR